LGIDIWQWRSQDLKVGGTGLSLHYFTYPCPSLSSLPTPYPSFPSFPSLSKYIGYAVSSPSGVLGGAHLTSFWRNRNRKKPLLVRVILCIFRGKYVQKRTTVLPVLSWIKIKKPSRLTEQSWIPTSLSLTTPAPFNTPKTFRFAPFS